MNKKIIVIAIILILIVITLGVVLGLIKNKWGGHPIVENNKQPITATTTSPALNDIDTSHWETYRNEELGFEFRHPTETDGWTVYRPPDYKGDGIMVDFTSFELSVNHFGSDGDVVAYNRKINDLLKDENYYMKKHWDITNREKIMLKNGLKAEKITWANNEIVFYIQKDDYPLTIAFTGYKNNLSELSFPAKTTEEEKNQWRAAYNKILLKITSSLKFIGN